MTRPDPTDRQLIVDLDRQLRETQAERDALTQRIQQARELLDRSCRCGDLGRHMREVDAVLAGES